jgi:heme/copper-type cytochrome/quinol oxidase subunit 3
MSAHSLPLPHDYPVDGQFGRATLGKMGMWFFLLSDSMSFSGLLLAYGILRGHSEVWRSPQEPVLGIPFTAVLTFILILSSVAMVMSYDAMVHRDKKGTLKWLGLTILGGVLFLCGQMQEYFGIFHAEHGLINMGLIFGHSHYATTFYCITSFHGMHVFTGVVVLSVNWLNIWRGKYDHDLNYNHLEIAGLFWHFVDLVWILVFTLVYLIPLE